MNTATLQPNSNASPISTFSSEVEFDNPKRTIFQILKWPIIAMICVVLLRLIYGDSPELSALKSLFVPVWILANLAISYLWPQRVGMSVSTILKQNTLIIFVHSCATLVLVLDPGQSLIYHLKLYGLGVLVFVLITVPMAVFLHRMDGRVEPD